MSGQRRDAAARSSVLSLPSSRTWRTHLLPPGLGLVLLIALQVLGGVYPWGMLTIAACALVMLGLTLAVIRPGHWPAPWLTAALLLGLGWTLVQVTPLPCGLVEMLAPDAAEHLRLTRALLGLDAPASCTITLDPGATREELVKGIAIVAVFATALLLAEAGTRRRVLWSVGGAVVLLALSAAGHAAVGAERVYGMYTPVDVHGFHFVAPIINPNTLGGLMALGTPLVLGLGLSSERRWVRAVAIASAALMVGIAMLTRSRGAAGALGLGLAAFGVLELRVLRSRSRRRREGAGPWLQRYGAMAAAVAVVGLVAYGFSQPMLREFVRGDTTKLELIARGAAAVSEAPLVGVGRGAFAAAFVGESTARARFEHAENLPIQWALEWGLPIALAMLVILASTILRAASGTRSPARAGGLAALIAIVAQNMLDLGLELLGVAVISAALLGAVAVSRAERRRRATDRQRRRVMGVAAGGWVLACALLSLMGPGLQRDHRPHQEQQLRELYAGADRARFERRLQEALLAHPAEPALVLLGASDRVMRRRTEAGRWINRAMQLAPTWAGPHDLAARWLWQAGREDQAMLEIREAMERDPHGSGTTMCAVLRARRDQVHRLLPRGETRAAALERAVECLGIHSPEGVALDRRFLEEYPQAPRPRLRHAERLHRAGKHAEAIEVLEGLMRDLPGTREILVLAARVLAAAGAHERLDEVLPMAIVAGGDALELRLVEARAHARRGDGVRTRASLDRLRALSAGKKRARVRALRLEAELLPALGDPGRALDALREAYGISNEVRDLEAFAAIAKEAGRELPGAWARREICRRTGGGRPGCGAMSELPPGGKTLNTGGKTDH